MYTYSFIRRVQQELAYAQRSRTQITAASLESLRGLGMLPEQQGTLSYQQPAPGTVITAYDSSQIYPDRQLGRDWYAIQTASISWEYESSHARCTYNRSMQSDHVPDTVDWYHAQEYVTQLRDGYERTCIARHEGAPPSLILVDGQRHQAHPPHVVGYVSQPRSRILESTIPDYIAGLVLLAPHRYLLLPQAGAIFIHTGREIGRLDLHPQSMALPNFITELLSAVGYHLCTGGGYPLALSYAHALAVIPTPVTSALDRLMGAHMSAKAYTKFMLTQTL